MPNECRRTAWLFLVLLACLQTSCVSVRPVIKIGLLAPFEGLYRRTGYTALAAMRAAIAETPVTGVDFLPLALDDGNDAPRARRGAQKMLADTSVQAIVGPLNPETLFSVLAVLPSSSLTWTAPFVVMPGTHQFADPRSATSWATDLLATVALAARRQHAQRLVLAGWTSGWPRHTDTEWTKLVGLPVLATDDSRLVSATDAVFWLGNPDDAALYLAKLRAVYPAVPFWVGPQGGDPVFVEQVKISGPVYWATWLSDDYPQWAAQHDPATPLAYLVYQATRQSIGALAKQTNLPAATTWHVQMFRIGTDGKSRPFTE